MKKLNVKLPQGGSKRALHSGMYASALAVVVLAVIILVNLVIRDADGKIVDSSSSVLVWKDMWEKNMFVGYFPRTPQTDGDYTLSIYIGNQLLDSAKFTVKS